jgi:CheY-like chemotaxis protein
VYRRGCSASASAWRIPRRSGPTWRKRWPELPTARVGYADCEEEVDLPRPFRILVAEDDESFLDAIALLLEQDARFAVAGRACDGREAVELAEQLSPDAVVMDIEMPVLDGVEATRRLRAAAPGLPIVAVSGHDYEERVLEIRQAGANDYVRKARLSDELPRVLVALLEHARRSARSRP